MIRFENISKSFPGVHALKNVSFEVAPGEVHGLVGENGAGKSTLMNIANGAYHADEGQMYLNDKKVTIGTPKVAHALGISMIFQEVHLVPTITIAENLFLGRLPKNTYGLVDRKALFQEAQTLLDQVGLQLSPNTMISTLSVGQQQMVQLAKAIATENKIVIMDEPTAALSQTETEKLFEVIEYLKKQNIAVIYISHRLEEIFGVTDRVTVLRDGTFIGTKKTEETNQDELIAMMVGRSLADMQIKAKTEVGSTVLEVKNLCRKDQFHDINFELKKGEVIGIYGLVGAGRTELALSIFGADPIDSGEIILDGQKLKITSPQDAIQQGLGYLSEDRKDKSILPIMSIKENITISSLKQYCNFIFPDGKKEEAITNSFMDKLSIRAHSIQQQIMTLSGGNQQKVVFSRLLALEPKVLILDEPTRGVDVGAKADMFSLIHELAETGIGIIFISSELPEVLANADRILVLSGGQITGRFTGHGMANQEDLLRAASPN